MEELVISGRNYFDRLPEAVAAERNGEICYYNEVMAHSADSYGIVLSENVLPGTLQMLEDGRPEELLLGGRPVEARVMVLEDGTRLYQLKERTERGGLGRYEAELLCSVIRKHMGEELEGLQALYDSMVETEQERLDPCFRKVFRPYCRILRSLNTAEVMLMPREEWQETWEDEQIELNAFFEELDLELVPVLRKLRMFYPGTECGEKLYIRGNRQLLRQALMHLLQNGVQHGRVVELRLRRQGDCALITVKDQGGDPMPSGELARLFGPCTEEDLEGETLKQGLKLCRRVFALHGGSMGLSGLSTGAVVTISLPLTAPEETDEAHGFEEDGLYFEEGIPEFMVELSEVLEERWYPACEMLE